MLRVLIADDHGVVRQGLRAILETSDEMIVVGEATDGLHTIEQVERLKPDVLLLDIGMPGMNGLDAIREIRRRELPVRILVLTMYHDDTYLQRALRNGADGYFVKRDPINQILAAIMEVAEGKAYLSSSISRKIVDAFAAKRKAAGRPEKAGDSARLTKRESQVLQHVIDGYTNEAIAEALCISPRTVEVHRRNLMRKLGARNRADLVKYASSANLIFGDAD